MSNERIKVGLVGCGKAGRNIHMRLLGLHADLYEVVGCADALAGSAAELAEDFGIQAAESVEALVASSDIELVVVPTKPPRTHRDVALQAFAAGKHVVVEKPMAGTDEECAEMVEAAGSADRVLAVHHNRRWDVDFMSVREAIESGALGELRLVRNEYTAGFSGSPYDWGIHLVDQTMCLSLGKSFTELSATFCAPTPETPTECEGFFSCRLRTEDGVLHDLSMLPAYGGNAYLPGKMPYRFTVVGTEGILYQDWCQRPEDAFAKPRFFQASETGKNPAEISGVSAQLAIPDFYESLYASIREGAPSPVPGSEARRAVRAWELTCESACAGRTLDVSL